MLVKNLSKRPVTLGRTVIQSNGTAEVQAAYLYQGRVRRLKAEGIIAYPWKGEPQISAAPASTKMILDVVSEVSSPQVELSIEESSFIKEAETDEEKQEDDIP